MTSHPLLPNKTKGLGTYSTYTVTLLQLPSSSTSKVSMFRIVSTKSYYGLSERQSKYKRYNSSQKSVNQTSCSSSRYPAQDNTAICTYSTQVRCRRVLGANINVVRRFHAPELDIYIQYVDIWIWAPYCNSVEAKEKMSSVALSQFTTLVVIQAPSAPHARLGICVVSKCHELAGRSQSTYRVHHLQLLLMSSQATWFLQLFRINTNVNVNTLRSREAPIRLVKSERVGDHDTEVRGESLSPIASFLISCGQEALQ
jgi:hypothetical protein